jgi:hypothetical protein
VKKVDLDFTKCVRHRRCLSASFVAISIKATMPLLIAPAAARYYTQTRAIGAFASVGLEEMAEAGSQSCSYCLRSLDGRGKMRGANAAHTQNIEMQRMEQLNDEEGDHVSLIQQEQV